MTRLDTVARSAIALALIALANGCASVAPPSEVPASAKRHGASDSPAAADVGVLTGVPTRAWWQDFGDPALNKLVDLSLEHNHDLRAALAALDGARVLALAEKREAYPRGGLEATGQAMRPSITDADPYVQGSPRPPSQRVASIAQVLAWEIDLFGRIGTAAAIADRQTDIAQADAHAVAALLQGEVVRNYVVLRHQQQALASITVEATASERRAHQMRSRVEAGLADRREALAADGDYAGLAAERAQVQATVEASTAALAVLVGRSPTIRDADLEVLLMPAALPAAPQSASLLQPADLLARRPDVAHADARLRAALGNVVLAERAHLPRLSLNVMGGLYAPFGSLSDSGATRYAAGPVLQWDWLGAGRYKAREAAARAGSQAAWHGFEQTVLTALQESETSLREWSAAQITLQQARSGEALARQAADHASARVTAGIESPPVALEQEAMFQQAHRNALAAQAGLLLAHARVQLALGAWQPPSNAVAAREAKP